MHLILTTNLLMPIRFTWGRGPRLGLGDGTVPKEDLTLATLYIKLDPILRLWLCLHTICLCLPHSHLCLLSINPNLISAQEEEPIPFVVDMLLGTRVLDVSVGGEHVLVRTAEGEAVTRSVILTLTLSPSLCLKPEPVADSNLNLRLEPNCSPNHYLNLDGRRGHVLGKRRIWAAGT